MANIFDKYTDVPGEAATPINEPISKAERQRGLKKKDLKVLKKLAKALRKQNRLMKQEAEKRKADEEAANAKTATTEKANKDKSNNGVRGFLGKLGDAICKAMPKVLTTLATLAFGYFVNTRFARKAPQVA